MFKKCMDSTYRQFPIPWRSSKKEGTSEGKKTVDRKLAPSLRSIGFAFKSVQRWKNGMNYSKKQKNGLNLVLILNLKLNGQDSEKYHGPNVILFGPYHHDKPHLRAAGNIKPICVRKFLAYSNQDIEDLNKKIESNIKAVRVCYDSLAMTKYNDEKLAWMMLLDGCFILQFIHSSTREEDTSNLLRNHEISLVELDLFLLENQIPFGIMSLELPESLSDRVIEVS